MWFSIFLAAALNANADDVVVVVDPNSTGVTERRVENVVTSLCTILSVPSLEVMDHLVLGENVAGAFLNKNTLLLTGQAIGNSCVEQVDAFDTNQIFAVFSIEPFAKLIQASVKGYLLSGNALFPDAQTYFAYLKGDEGVAYAVVQYKNSESHGQQAQRIVGFANSDKIVFSYELPETDKFLTKIQPIASQYLLLHVMPTGSATASTLKLLNIKSGRIVGVLSPGVHIREIIGNLAPMNSCFAIIDNPGIDEGEKIALITCQEDALKMDMIDMPIVFDTHQENVVFGIGIDARRVLLGVGPSDAIHDIYMVDYQARTASKVISLTAAASCFSVTTDKKYLLTSGAEKPQISVYDLATYKLLGSRPYVSAHPSLMLTN